MKKNEVTPLRAAMFLCLILVVQAAVVHHDVGQETSSSHLRMQKPKAGKAASNHFKKFNPFAGHHHPSDRLTCGVTETVGSHTDKYEDCPAGCPYFAQNRKDTAHCTFLCVPGEDCGKWNPNKPIPDSIKSSKTCRGPKVAFCSEPTMDGKDNCVKCQTGYTLHSHDGQCYFEQWNLIIGIGAIFAVLGVIVVAWVIDLCCREPINQDAVSKAEEWRSRSKILTTKVDGQQRHVHDIRTNLCKNDIAGPGILLHFRFQAFIIVWSFMLAMVWVAFACFHNELFILGTRKFGTPRHNCILVAWGYETQQRLMWTKVLFLVIAYVGSFVSFLMFSVSQLRTYQKFSSKEVTMRDFAVELKGLPQLPCSHPDVEKDLKAAVEKVCQCTLVGVSVAWSFTDKQELIDRACRKDLIDKENREMIKRGETPLNLADEPDPTANMGAVHKWMYNKEKSILGPDDEEDDNVKAELDKLVSTDSAFIVFNSQGDKEAALAAHTEVEFDATKYGFGKETLTMEFITQEPANLNWHNFDNEGQSAMVGRFLKGFFKVYVPALLIWFLGFYVPYAMSLYYFNYDNGAELPGYFSLIFTVVICGGNATMYVVCDVCCDIIGFRYKDSKQVTYMIMYLAACMINVFLDMGVTYFTAMKIMVGLDFRTYHGERLADITTFTEQFETYAMQRSLGENVYRYAWPSTFFLCFVLEPFVTIIVPYMIGRAIVRTHREIQGACAEAYMAAFEFDLGRYADILLNVFLGILIFFFPGGYIWTLFFAMCFSHCFIYCFDHWRVISVIPYVKITSMEADWAAQYTMGGCCAVILSCLVFKANCESYSGYCIQGSPLIAVCTVAGLVHFIVHTLVLAFVVPKLGLDPVDLNADSHLATSFTTAASKEPRTWFSANPIHCLRSQYLHKDEPHCRLAMWGKEHFLEVNPKIGCHFTDQPAETEIYSNDLRKSMTLKYDEPVA